MSVRVQHDRRLGARNGARQHRINMIGLNDFARQWDAIRVRALAAVERVGSSGWYILGEEVKKFERELALYWGLPSAIGVGNGLDAIEIGLRALGLQPGEKVLTTPMSAFATTLAIMRCGAVPVFADTDESGLVDLDGCARALSSDRSIRYFVPVHLYGKPLDMDQLAVLKDDFELNIVEDCAQAIGAKWNDQPVGSVGQAAAVSFYPTKNLGALGDGGALLTADPEIEAKARSLRHYGQTATYVHDDFGMNSRLDELHAAVLTDAMLPMLDEWTARRRAVALKYQRQIMNTLVRFPAVSTGSEAAWHLFPVMIDASKRAAFRDHLQSRGVSSGLHYPRVIPEQKALRDYGHFEVIGVLTQARLLAACEVSIPIHPYLSDDETTIVCDAVNSWGGTC